MDSGESYASGEARPEAHPITHTEYQEGYKDRLLIPDLREGRDVRIRREGHSKESEYVEDVSEISIWNADTSVTTLEFPCLKPYPKGLVTSDGLLLLENGLAGYLLPVDEDVSARIETPLEEEQAVAQADPAEAV